MIKDLGNNIKIYSFEPVNLEPVEFSIGDDLIKGVFDSRYGPDKLPKTLYNHTFMALIAEVREFFGLPSDFTNGSAPWRLATRAKNSLGIFSSAKTFQNVLELSIAVFDNKGAVKPFADFRDQALTINNRYNLTWLETERQATVRQSQAIEAWQDIEQDRDIFPLLQYETVGDQRVRDEHYVIDQVIKPIDDDFWSTWFPPNGFNCRCIVKRLTEGPVTDRKFEKNTDTIFGSNVGKDGIIFPKEHPYNAVPKAYQKDAANNFGFTVPTDKDIKDFLK